MGFKKTLIIFFILISFMLIILNIVFNKSKIGYKIVEFKKDTQIFIDRKYTNTNYSNFLNDTILLQTGRHNYKKILIYSNSPVVIYRPTCSSNFNDDYRANWKILKSKVKIKGFSCEHSKVYFKRFNGPLILLNAGGPVASDPIFIKFNQKKNKIIVLNKLNKR
jgi:hypothetical protein